MFCLFKMLGCSEDDNTIKQPFKTINYSPGRSSHPSTNHPMPALSTIYFLKWCFNLYHSISYHNATSCHQHNALLEILPIIHMFFITLICDCPTQFAGGIRQTYMTTIEKETDSGFYLPFPVLHHTHKFPVLHSGTHAAVRAGSWSIHSDGSKITDTAFLTSIYYTTLS